MAKEKKKKKKNMEDTFRKRSETLRDFYSAQADSLSENEKSSLTPILNSLKEKGSRYKKTEEIATGGEKKIIKAHDRMLDREIALAFSVRAKNDLDQEQFLREARVTANLTHPNIMPVYNIGVDEENHPFFSMELVRGDSLKTIIEKLKEGDEEYKQNYPLEVLLNIFIKICNAIAYAHSRHVLHLDIKPDNIRVGTFGEVFVCDWGLARVLNDGVSTEIDEVPLDADTLNDMTLSGMVKGTPGFMAPEQTEMNSVKTYQTDIYSLGSLLYMLLTYERPVQGKSANEMIENTKKGQIISPRKLQPEWRISYSLVAVCMKALSLNPEKRYKSVLSLRKEIDRYLSGYPTHAERPSFIIRLTFLVKRHNQITFVVLFSLLLLAAINGRNLVTISQEKADAVMAIKRAEENFALYVKEQKLSKALGKNLEQAVLYTVKTRDFINAPSMIHVLETGLRENVDTLHQKNLLEQKGVLHFVLQEFAAASECFDKAGDLHRAERLKILSKKYAKIKTSDKAQLSDQQLAYLIHEAKQKDKMTLFYLYYHHMRRRPLSASSKEYLPLSFAILDKMNNKHFFEKKQFNRLKKVNGGYELDLSRTPYSIYSLNIAGLYRKNILQPLHLKKLNISYSRFKNSDELKGLNLETLMMYGVNVKNKRRFLQRLFAMHTSWVGLTEKYYPKQMLEELKNIMIVDEK